MPVRSRGAASRVCVWLHVVFGHNYDRSCGVCHPRGAAHVIETPVVNGFEQLEANNIRVIDGGAIRKAKVEKARQRLQYPSFMLSVRVSSIP